MTQLPQPPPMPPPEPLDDAERVLARALRNLPVGMPPPELDARILGAARRSVHLAQPPKRDRRWLIGIGTAASALLAIGIMVKTHGPGGNNFYTPPAANTAAPAAAAPSNAPASDAADAAAEAAAPMDARKIEPPPPAEITPIGNPQQPLNMVPPKDVPQAPPAGGYGRDQADNGMAAKQAQQAFPATVAPPPRLVPAPAIVQEPAAQMQTERAPPPVVVDRAMPMSTPAPAPMASAPPARAMPAPPPPPAPTPSASVREERQAETVGSIRSEKKADTDAAAGKLSGEVTDQPALSKAASGPEQGNSLKSDGLIGGQAAGGSSGVNDEKARNLDSVTVTGSRIDRVESDKEQGLPAVSLDVKLTPAQWIERIRARVKADDDDGARASLKLYLAHYPDADVPVDLQPLQQ